jgi:hypothetical protein
MTPRTLSLVGPGAGSWSLKVTARARRRGSVPAEDAFVAALTKTGGLAAVTSASLASSDRRGAVSDAVADLEIDAAPDEALVLVARHPSGALTFHPPLPSLRRGRRGAVRFSVRSQSPTGRRGVLGAAVAVVVLKVVGALAGKLLPQAVGLWERAAWRRKGLVQGLLRVTPETLPGRLTNLATSADFVAPPGRNLLLIHGTFSHAEGAFGGLVTTRGTDGRTLFDALAGSYGSHVFAFNHLTVSQSPAQNARDLLAGLPQQRLVFDVVTHSRGGLVLRELVEGGSPAPGFELGHAVLVAAPNQGTPLADTERWERLLGYWANLADLFPGGPVVLAVEFVAAGLSWLARHATLSLPGLEAMRPKGEAVARLQGEPLPRGDAYSALLANTEPQGALLARLLDAGIDAFFATANDLVVPSRGSWVVDAQVDRIPGSRIGCYGPGGNLTPAVAETVHHLNYFGEPATVDFLVRALSRQPQPLRAVDPTRDLPYRLGGGYRGAPGAPAARVAVPAVAVPTAAASVVAPAPLLSGPPSADNVLQLLLVEAGRGHAQLVASFRNARVVEAFPLSGQRWKEIIGVDRAIRDYIDGDPKRPSLPSEKELLRFGSRLFDTLFPPLVRRLYDEARALRGANRLDIVLTAQVVGRQGEVAGDWIAGIPWEFAYDSVRRTYLATEEINFVRNVRTAIPAEEGERQTGPLSILVAIAQPLGAGQLSADEETQLVRRAFADLEKAGLATITVVRAATPEILHRHLQVGHWDVLHFIGHGEYDRKQDRGFLLFEDGAGGAQPIDAESIRQIVAHRGVRLVFLNACETGTGGRSDFNRGVAPKLVAAGVPAVVANQYSVLDVSAASFAQHFYWALAQGRSVGDAAREARIGVNYGIHGESIDWAVPVVYARNPLEGLTRPAPQAQLVALDSLMKARQQVRRRATGRLRVALWDVNQAVPALEAIAGRLNSVQSAYQFEVMDLPAPQGTWRRLRREDGAGLLHGGQMRERLRFKPRELGVSHLFCITSFRLGDDDTDDLYIWDELADPSHSDSERISLFSLHEWSARLQPPGTTLQRAVANALASCLANIQEHKRGPKNCPLYYNANRRTDTIAGRLKFEPSCRKRVREAGSKEGLQALEAILRAFD